MNLRDRMKKYNEAKVVYKNVAKRKDRQLQILYGQEKEITARRADNLSMKIKACIVMIIYKSEYDDSSCANPYSKETMCCENFLPSFSSQPQPIEWRNSFVFEYIAHGFLTGKWKEVGGDTIAIENEKCKDCWLKQKREKFIKTLRLWEKETTHYYNCRKTKRNCFFNIFKFNNTIF